MTGKQKGLLAVGAFAAVTVLYIAAKNRAAIAGYLAASAPTLGGVPAGLVTDPSPYIMPPDVAITWFQPQMTAQPDTTQTVGSTAPSNSLYPLFGFLGFGGYGVGGGA